ncbi:hypothetical protein CFC21_096065 [Triticum aestivum]|uniref:GDSL esterase/lipase n=3 Tax=Triticum aestivum TaxID=4565 RepID=A0A9R1LRE2_WHEAT|nr:hypothetical protein CFC21_096063 [Triticum aestivum]KAF7093663.1 hypothetical protein CFC21_096065 [Triticum aestivum]
MAVAGRGIAGVAPFVVLSCCLVAALAAAGGGTPRYNAIFNLGDSTSDTGNICPRGRHEPAGVLGIFARIPYGITYFGKPSCRCCDGRLNVDFLAQALGLPLLPPSKARGEDFRRGANMAMIGGTARDYSGSSMFTGYGVHLDGSMDSQMEALRRLLPSICGTRQSCKEYLAKSLFVFQLGENDYNIQLVNGSTVHEARKSIPSIVNTITSGVEKLIALGAVDIVVSNVAPMGCYPLYLNFFESSDKDDYNEYGCLRNHNALFDRHNSFLKNGLKKLQKKHQHTRIMHADLASHVYQMVQDPKRFGFGIETILMGCCGKANAPNGFDLLAMCGMDGSSICRDPGSHLTWDGMHLSDAANKLITEGWLSGMYCNPSILQ